MPADHLNLLIAGAARSGTTSLKSYLATHPEIAFLGRADLEFEGEEIGLPFTFPIPSRARRGNDPAVYRTIARRLSGQVEYIGAKEPFCLVHPHIPVNLAGHIPDIRIIVILRNPVEATHSLFWHYRRHGIIEDGTLEDAIDVAMRMAADLSGADARERWFAASVTTDARLHLLERGLYIEHLRRYTRCLSRRQVHVLATDDLRDDPRTALRGVLSFLDLDPSFEFPDPTEVRNAAPADTPPLAAETRSVLEAFFGDATRELVAEFDWPRDRWDCLHWDRCPAPSPSS